MNTGVGEPQGLTLLQDTIREGSGPSPAHGEERERPNPMPVAIYLRRVPGKKENGGRPLRLIEGV